MGVNEKEISLSLFQEHDTLLANQQRLSTELKALRVELFNLIDDRLVPLDQKLTAKLRREPLSPSATPPSPQPYKTGIISHQDVVKMKERKL